MTEEKQMKKYLCRICGNEFDYDNAIFECKPDVCEYCTQEDIQDCFNYGNE